MKKSIKSLMMLLPMALVLGACGPNNINTNVNNAQENEEAAQSTCYLVLTRNGLYNGKKGEDVPEKYLENTITYKAAIGSKLPGKDVITSSIKDVEFTNWISYENAGKPTIHTVLPEAETVLYAFFKTNNIHNGEQSEVTPDSTPDPEVPTAEKLTIKSDKQEVEAEFTGKADGVEGSKQYHANVTFAADEVWNINYKTDEKVDKWERGSGSAFTAKQMTASTKEGANAGDATVVVAGTYDIYIKIYSNGWINCWVSANKGIVDPQPDASSSETVDEDITITATNLQPFFIKTYDFGIWSWADGQDGTWVKPTVNAEEKSLTFTVPNSRNNFIVAAFDKGATLDWNNKLKQTSDIKIESGVTTYDISKLWK